MDKQELSAKKEILKTLMKCPHRKLEETKNVFETALKNDPLFAGKCFYALTLDEFNQIRDLEESGISFLLTSPHWEHREAGRVLFQKLEPYRAFRVSNFVKNGLKPNRQVKGAITDYLNMLEANTHRFDGAARVAGSKLHKMYEFYHIKPGKRAQDVLFDNKTADGEVDILEVLRNTEDPNVQAEIISTNKVPYRQATSVIKNLTPAVWVALIDVMSVSEAINARASVEASGILNDKTIRVLYETKLAKAGTDKKVAGSTLGERKSVKGKDERLNEIIKNAEQTKVDNTIGITDDVLLAVDISGSMQSAIELAKRIGPYLATVCKGKLDVMCFNETAVRINYGKGTIEDFRKGFSLIRANGQTSLGSALMKSIADKFIPDIMIIVTDQGENHSPRLETVFNAAKSDLRFIFINVPNAGDVVAKQLEAAGADVSEFSFDVDVDSKGWYSSLDNFSTLLNKGGYDTLVQRIMDLRLPVRGKI
jgi:Mg-chelatase subunit ChlD